MRDIRNEKWNISGIQSTIETIGTLRLDYINLKMSGNELINLCFTSDTPSVNPGKAVGEMDLLE